MKLLLVLSFALGAWALGKSYEGYQVLSVTPHSRHQMEQLMGLDEQFNYELDIWNTAPPGKPSNVMVPPYHLARFRNTLDKLGMEYTVHFNNVQRLIDDEARAIKARPKAITFDYTVYHSYQEIQDWVTDFRQDNSAGALTIEEFQLPDLSYEGRAIKGLKLTTGSGRLGAYTQGGIHAREWVSPATVINVVRQFVDAYNSGDSVATEFFSKFDWYVIPLLNVDGYHYTRPESSPYDRMWRKNKQDTGSAFCEGIDMNRNYGYEWGGSGSSSNKCDETYAGQYAYEAVELNSAVNFLMDLKSGGQDFMIFVDVHSYSQYWVYAYSYTYSFYHEAVDNADLNSVALASITALKAVHGTSYSYMASGDWYPAAGSSEDFGYETLGAKYSYTIEMRDTGRYGFELPERFIEPTGEETYAGFREFFRLVSLEV